jgi:ribose transport system substrate-binding protein
VSGVYRPVAGRAGGVESIRHRAVALLCTAVIVAACGAGQRQRHAGTEEDPWIIGMSQCNLGEPWRVQMDADVREAAAEHPNLRVIFKDAQNNSLTQRAQVEEFVEQGVDLIVISPKEAAPLTAPVAEAVRQGIPVIVLDRAVQGDEYTVFIGADNVRIGRQAGKWLREALGGAGRIVELEGLMTSTPGQDRHRGFLEGLDQAANPGLEIVFTGEMQWLEPNARREMESALAILNGEQVPKQIVLGTRLFTAANVAEGGEAIN